jgi:hypothetical protein
MKKFRTKVEQDVGSRIANIFESCSDSVEIKLENFTKYVRRQYLKRFLALYELFKLVLPVKGSVVECGVYKGFSLMAFAKLSAMLEPENLTRRIYGFDTFEGFRSITEQDDNPVHSHCDRDLFADSFEELNSLILEYDKDRFLGHLPKVSLIKGNVCETIPSFIEKNKHLVLSLLFLDMDLFEPTKIAIESFIPKMPRGAILAFDELDNPMWPGETLALLETIGVRNLELRRFEWDPYISYAIL